MRTILKLLGLCLVLATYGCEKQKALPGLLGIRFGQPIDKENKRIEIVNFGVGQRIEPVVKIPKLSSYVVFGQGKGGVSTIRAAGLFGTKEEARNQEKAIIRWLEENISGIKFQIIPMIGMREYAHGAYFRSASDQSKVEQIVIVKRCVGNEVVVLANDMTIDGFGLLNMLNDREMDTSLHEEMFTSKPPKPLPKSAIIQTSSHKGYVGLCGILLGETIKGEADFMDRAIVLKTKDNSWLEPERIYYLKPKDHFIEPMHGCTASVSLQDHKVSKIQCVRTYTSKDIDKIKSDYSYIVSLITSTFNCISRSTENKGLFWSDKWKLENEQEILLGFNGFNFKDEGNITVTLLDTGRMKRNRENAKKKGSGEF
ncbi:MAG: hypothetical protein K6G44_13325 [Lentisphaeria bacterium]|nr:hypothetical protein [Lentisphaeria bacterium]